MTPVTIRLPNDILKLIEANANKEFLKPLTYLRKLIISALDDTNNQSNNSEQNLLELQKTIQKATLESLAIARSLPNIILYHPTKEEVERDMSLAKQSADSYINKHYPSNFNEDKKQN
jgi:hypothetical protein